MEKFNRSYERFSKALKKFKEVVDTPLLSEIFSDEFIVEITTKRFEYTYEAMWKAVKEFLRNRGLECNSPKSCFKELLKEGVIDQEVEKTLSEMVLLRNYLVHVYDESQAKEIYNRIKELDILKTFEVVYRGLRS
ncbi:MAG: nucleotidyltransferase substrate binding protein [Hydrogenothermaceae bacterium]|nr:nucleotidyltransferase substrate binding protein [Hydrogenothermaceae bacterium]